MNLKRLAVLLSRFLWLKTPMFRHADDLETSGSWTQRFLERYGKTSLGLAA